MDSNGRYVTQGDGRLLFPSPVCSRSEEYCFISPSRIVEVRVNRGRNNRRPPKVRDISADKTQNSRRGIWEPGMNPALTSTMVSGGKSDKSEVGKREIPPITFYLIS